MGEERTRIADVLFPLRLDHPYSYRLPRGERVNEGQWVRAQIGPRTETGVVWQVRDEAPPGGQPGGVPGGRLKPISEILDLPPMRPVQRRFIEWLADYYLAEKGAVLRLCMAAREAFLPPRELAVWQVSGKQPQRLTAQREKVLNTARANPPLTTGELARLAGVSTSVVRGLAETGALSAASRPKDAPFEPPDLSPHLAKRLSGEQQEAADALREAVRGGGFSVTLLDGVTGSGKTEVYFEAMAEALAGGGESGQVLLLLPEIALTGQFMRRVAERFNARPAEWHSDMSAAARARVFRGVASGKARIVVAARSGLFLPWRSLRLIVVDEEHESAYKQEGGVPYHGRDMAVLLGSLGGFPVVLSSATPSLESLVNAENGRYGHLTLRRRHGKALLPEISLIDMREHAPASGEWLSTPLVEAVSETLEKGRQALLFLNRRGYAPLTLCRACGQRLQCPHCSAWLVQHRFRNILMCHHCGHQQPLANTCPSCGAEGKMAAVGPGVERLAEEAGWRWPDARVAVLSSDLQGGARLKELLEAVARGEYDIIIGTQLVAKGHHFPNLALAGIVDADLALENADPRAGERTWQLLAQVAGRAGRAEHSGRALVQTWLADHPLMRALAAGDRDGFLEHEKKMRKAAGMPPYGRLAALIISGRDEQRTWEFCRALAARKPRARDILALGPAPAPIAVVRRRFRYRFLVKGPRNADMQAYLRAWLAGLKIPGHVKLEVDMDPYSFL